MPDEAQTFASLTTPPAPAPGAPAPDPQATPAWADQLLQTVTDIRGEFDAFKEQLTQPEPEPEPVQTNNDWVPKTYADVDQRIVDQARAIAEQTLTQREQQANAAIAEGG